MIQLERPVFALYQLRNEVASSQGDSGAWHLMNVQLINPEVSPGIHPLEEISITGLATMIPATFESEHLKVYDRTKSSRVISHARASLHISNDEIIRALGNKMVVVYIYTETNRE